MDMKDNTSNFSFENLKFSHFTSKRGNIEYIREGRTTTISRMKQQLVNCNSDSWLVGIKKLLLKINF